MTIKTATQISTVIDALKTEIMTNAATLGGITAVYEKDEHPGVALENNEIPCAYVIPIVEGKGTADFTIGGAGSTIRHEFPITIIAYYKADDVNSFIATNRNYLFNMIDIIEAKRNMGGYMIYKAEYEVGYYEVSGDIVHFWIVKLFGKLWY